jgi:hypothetical protein
MFARAGCGQRSRRISSLFSDWVETRLAPTPHVPADGFVRRRRRLLAFSKVFDSSSINDNKRMRRLATPNSGYGISRKVLAKTAGVASRDAPKSSSWPTKC